jgi:hypothetical protein
VPPGERNVPAMRYLCRCLLGLFASSFMMIKVTVIMANANKSQM